MSKVRIAMVGTGEISQNFRLPILSKLSNVEIVALNGRNKTKNAILADKYKIKYSSQDYQDIIERDDVDAIMLCVPTEIHFDFAMRAIEKGKHLFIEKPIAITSEEAIKLNKAAKEKNVKVMVGMNHRFREDARILKTFITNNEIGKVLYIKSGWLQKKHFQDGHLNEKQESMGVMNELGLSLIDSILWLYQNEKVHSVQADLFYRMGKSFEDMGIAKIKFESGCVATLECNYAIYTPNTNYYFNLYGEKGSIQINPIMIFKGNNDIVKPNANTSIISNLEVYKKSYEAELKHFVNSILGFVPVFSSLEESILPMQIMEKMYQSAKENREIIF